MSSRPKIPRERKGPFVFGIPHAVFFLAACTHDVFPLRRNEWPRQQQEEKRAVLRDGESLFFSTSELFFPVVCKKKERGKEVSVSSLHATVRGPRIQREKTETFCLSLCDCVLLKMNHIFSSEPILCSWCRPPYARNTLFFTLLPRPPFFRSLSFLTAPPPNFSISKSKGPFSLLFFSLPPFSLPRQLRDPIKRVLHPPPPPPPSFPPPLSLSNSPRE